MVRVEPILLYLLPSCFFGVLLLFSPSPQEQAGDDENSDYDNRNYYRDGSFATGR
jgi:hypothetical protein